MTTALKTSPIAEYKCQATGKQFKWIRGIEIYSGVNTDQLQELLELIRREITLNPTSDDLKAEYYSVQGVLQGKMLIESFNSKCSQ